MEHQTIGRCSSWSGSSVVLLFRRFFKIKPNDTLILKAVVCCLKIWCTISGKMDAVISCMVKLYRSWTRFHCFPGWYSSVLNKGCGSPGLLGGFGIHLGQMVDGRTDCWMTGDCECVVVWRTIGWSRGCRSLHLWSLLGLWSFVQSPVTEHVCSSMKILTTNGTGNRVVVGFLVAFLIIGTAEFVSADVAGIGL